MNHRLAKVFLCMFFCFSQIYGQEGFFFSPPQAEDSGSFLMVPGAVSWGIPLCVCGGGRKHMASVFPTVRCLQVCLKFISPSHSSCPHFQSPTESMSQLRAAKKPIKTVTHRLFRFHVCNLKPSIPFCPHVSQFFCDSLAFLLFWEK